MDGHLQGRGNAAKTAYLGAEVRIVKLLSHVPNAKLSGMACFVVFLLLAYKADTASTAVIFRISDHLTHLIYSSAQS